MLRAVAILVVFALSLVPIGHLSAQPQPYEINAIVSLTGPAAFIGVSIAKTLGLVEAAANRHGGINGRPVKFVLADDQSSPQVTVQLLTRLAGEKVPLVFGPGFVATCAAAMPITARSGPVTWCTSPGIYPPAGGYAFATGATTDDTTLVLVRYMRERGWKRLGVMASTDASGQAWDHGLQYALSHPENKDVQIVAYEHMNPADISVAGQWSRIKAANPQALLTLATGPAWGTIMRGLGDAGLDLPVGGGNGNMSYAQLDQYQSFLPRDLYFPGLVSLVPNSIGNGPVKEAQAVFSARSGRRGSGPTSATTLPGIRQRS